MPTNKHRIYVTLDAETDQKVCDLAKRKKIAMSRVINDLILIALALKSLK